MRVVPFSALLVVLAVGTAGRPLAAQRRELAFVAGLNRSGANGGRVAHSEAKQGFQTGLSLRLPRSTNLYFQTELLLVQRHFFGERSASTQPPLSVGPRSDDAKLLYAQIPVLLRIQKGYSTVRPVRPFVVLGGYVGIRVGCSRVLTQYSGGTLKLGCTADAAPSNNSPDQYFAAVYQEIDAGVMGEVGVELLRLSLKLRGERSVRNLVDPGAVPTSPFEKSRMWVGSVSLEYMFRVI